MTKKYADQNGGGPAAKMKTKPTVDLAIEKMDNLFLTPKLDFSLVFFPDDSFAPEPGGSISDYGAYIGDVSSAFKNIFPCIQADVIIVFSDLLTVQGHGFGTVALVKYGFKVVPICHEIGHNLGLQHPGLGCPDDCNPAKFMCTEGGDIISFNNCDLEKLSDNLNGVFSQLPLSNPNHCNLWTDYITPISGNYVCPAVPNTQCR